MESEAAEGPIGKAITTIAALCIASSIIMSYFSDIGSAQLHEVMQVGGAVVGVIGWLMWRSWEI